MAEGSAVTATRSFHPKCRGPPHHVPSSPAASWGPVPSPSFSWRSFCFPPVAFPTGVRSPRPRPLPSKSVQLCANPQHPNYFCLGPEGPLHPGLSELTPFASPPTPTKCKSASLLGREAEEAHPTHRPQREHPLLHPGGKSQQVPVPPGLPREQGAWAKGLRRALHTSTAQEWADPTAFPPPALWTQTQGSCPVLPFPPLFLYLIIKGTCHQCELSFSRKYWLK